MPEFDERFVVIEILFRLAEREAITAPELRESVLGLFPGLLEGDLSDGSVDED